MKHLVGPYCIIQQQPMVGCQRACFVYLMSNCFLHYVDTRYSAVWVLNLNLDFLPQKLIPPPSPPRFIFPQYGEQQLAQEDCCSETLNCPLQQVVSWTFIALSHQLMNYSCMWSVHGYYYNRCYRCLTPPIVDSIHYTSLVKKKKRHMAC